ncbi:GlsB/YeaQ/YmgE family stress response membrane protein [Alteraurantiacibacter aquimixticola]|uniref:GlsB/YeaQ/YmgE family stress response membrane protein n=1 Tax=Alteraurantiacibacter aquimixticola TaxID=2489173 RepID=A0A4T3F0R5_9SPHN|nr:GlsB/YeaQ/YmgE family stress response membrane protein [Alteraurantiacibacter aquimixticola]TIX48942.1 GlsB/YeaQ/YmgE family stress response membrane protein [Alteraurantiacibacter aquimixticola]
MGLIFLILLGAVLGWLVTIVVSRGRMRELKLNVLLGTGGSLLTGLVINPLIGVGSLLRGTYSVEALLISFVGSLLLLVSVNLLRRSEMR